MDNLLDHGQSQAASLGHIGPGLVGAVETFKELRQFLLFDAAAVIGKGKEICPFPAIGQGNGQMADGLVFIFQAVAQDIFNDPLELLTVHRNDGLVQGGLEGHVQLLLVEMVGLFVDIIL